MTFLGAHAVPSEYDRRADEYVALVCGEMLDACAPFARWIDVFCEGGAFDADQSRVVLEAGRAAGLGLRVHGNQLGPGRGCSSRSSSARRRSTTARTSRTSTSTRSPKARPWPPSFPRLIFRPPALSGRPPRDRRRRRVAIATNCNPGSSYTTSMAFCIALAVRDMHMTAEEALLAATGAVPERSAAMMSGASPAPERTPSILEHRRKRTSSTDRASPWSARRW